MLLLNCRFFSVRVWHVCSLVCCLAGVLLLGVVSAVYDGINLYAYGL